MDTIKIHVTKDPINGNVTCNPVKVVVESAAHTEASCINSTILSKEIAMLHVAQKFSWLKFKLACT